MGTDCHLPPILIRSRPADQMRYDTAGDWYAEGGMQVIDVVEGDADATFLIALHELCEWWLCQRAGVTETAVDAFDIAKWAALQSDGEPGDHPDAPYRKQHRQAMLIEHLMAQFLGLTDYGKVE